MILIYTTLGSNTWGPTKSLVSSVSSTCVFYLTLDTLYVSFVSVVAGHSNLLIMGRGSDVAG